MDSITEDVILQFEAAEDEENMATPLGIVGGLQIKSDGDQVLDILNCGSLAVQPSDGRGFKRAGQIIAIR